MRRRPVRAVPTGGSLDAWPRCRPKLAEIVDEFAAAPRDVVLEMLLEYADVIPPLPAGSPREGMEQVPECQTSFFLRARVQPGRHR